MAKCFTVIAKNFINVPYIRTFDASTKAIPVAVELMRNTVKDLLKNNFVFSGRHFNSVEELLITENYNVVEHYFNSLMSFYQINKSVRYFETDLE